jgi:hypothetical protein
VIGWAFFISGEDPKRTIHPSPTRCSRELWMAGKKGRETLANGNNGNQFKADEIIRFRQACPSFLGF